MNDPGLDGPNGVPARTRVGPALARAARRGGGGPYRGLLLFPLAGFAVAAAALFAFAALGMILKHAFHRPRPTIIPRLASAFTSSFPSGHALDSAVTYGTIALLAGRLASLRLRRLIWGFAALAALLAIAIGVSRVYVDVHYPSDVLAGWLAGLMWIALLVVSTRLFPALFRRSGPAGSGDPDEPPPAGER